MDAETQKGLDEANRLYWTSTKGVNQIADELGLSKGMLYGAILPKPSGFRCPDCRDELGYANRTALEKAELSCPSCGAESTETEARERQWLGIDAPASSPLSASDGAAGPTRPLELRGRGSTEGDAGMDVGRRIPTDTVGIAPRPGADPGARALMGAAALCVGLGVWIGRRLR